jgi:hypothetical protein
MCAIDHIWKTVNMRERRKNFRVEWNSFAKMFDCNGHFIGRCVVSNFSNGGARITGVHPDTAPDKFILRLTSHGRAHQCQIVWRSKDGFGVEFTDYVKGTNAPEKRDRQKTQLPV